jgi:iron complex outermembrane receptor protein
MKERARRLCNVFATARNPLCLLFFAAPYLSASQTNTSPRSLKKLSIEELMNVEVNLVSRTPQKLSEAASAVQVITGEDIQRSGATNIPEALRLINNLPVAQLSANAWIISARGFNTTFANKLLVMIDGRTVYTPLFGGVIWEQQNVLLEDVERIEVVSGPGGSLWGANAVNGVINIVTKHTKETQGLYAMVSAGSFIKDMAAVRYGAKLGNKVYYKLYGQHFDRKNTTMPNGTKNTDAWGLTQAGFKADWSDSVRNTITVQGDWYGITRKTVPGKSSADEENILARLTHTFKDSSGLTFQLYYDRYYTEDARTNSYDKLNTFDVDFQHRFHIRSRNAILWGLGYRLVKDDANYRVIAGAGILPRYKRLDLFNSFIQDEISLWKNIKLTVGTKFLHNVYTGFELQPGARISWINKGSTLWGAVSRAVRTPSRLDADFYLPMTPTPPNQPSVAGGPNFISEKLIAYEAGYRLQPNRVSSFSIALFYNVYNDVYSVEALPGTLTYQIQNGAKGKSWGAEFSGNYQLTQKWRIRAGYTYIDKDLKSKTGHNFDPSYLANDVKHHAMLQSIIDLPMHFQFDVCLRYLGKLPKTFATEKVDAYTSFDARLAYSFKAIELAVTGQNLAEKNHTEYGTYNIPRSIYLKISTRL